MKKHFWVPAIVMVSFLEIGVLIALVHHVDVPSQNTIAVNEVMKTLEEGGEPPVLGVLDYVLLDGDGNVCFRTREHLRESVQEAISHRDTILEVESSKWEGFRVIFCNDTAERLQAGKKRLVIGLGAVLLSQWGLVICSVCYLEKVLVRPFWKLQEFARRVAGGNLDIPLEMDRKNIFGAFTESFDMMRTELKRARIAEARANESKKELVAKLSHDIRTPVASIKAVSEVGVALSEAAYSGAIQPDYGRLQASYGQIIQKADQINALVTNLFTATLEEMQQLAVTPADMESKELEAMLAGADYLHRGNCPPVPDCLLWADGLRLQQVFDNLFANSYKYAGTAIEVAIEKEDWFLRVSLEDAGGGVPGEELPLLKERFRRGSNAKGIEGAGLGLFIADSFMKQMQGGLVIENGAHGLKVSVQICLSGPAA